MTAGRAEVGDVLVTPWGEIRVVLEVEGAHEYIARQPALLFRFRDGVNDPTALVGERAVRLRVKA